MKSDFIIVNDKKDLPKETYEKTHHIYLCVLPSGRTLTCKFTDRSMFPWENAMNYRDCITTVVAYKRIILPEEILARCTGGGKSHQIVEYIDGLK